MDISLGPQSGLELIPTFKKHLPDTKILVLTIMENEPYRFVARQAGAGGLVRQSNMSPTLIPTISG